MPLPTPPASAAQEYDRVAVEGLDTRYAALRLPCPEVVSALTRSIARHGVLHPLTVNRESEGLAVLDGFKRIQALGTAIETLVPVRIVSLPPARATAAMVTFNRPHRGLSDLEEAWIVEVLVRDHAMLQKDVAELLGRHKSWVCRRLQLAQQLESRVVDDIRLGLVSATMGRELVRLPRGNQARVAAAAHRHGLTTRQTAELVGRCLEAPEGPALDELLSDPLRFIGGRTEPQPTAKDPRLTPSAEAVRRSLVRLDETARFTAGTLRKYGPVALSKADIEALADVVTASIDSATTVTELAKQLVDA